MIVQYAINSTAWTPITEAGQSGECWLDEQSDGAAGTVDVRVWHSALIPPGDDEVTKGKRVYKPGSNHDTLTISADTLYDIYYARCADAGSTAIISVDVT